MDKSIILMVFTSQKCRVFLPTGHPMPRPTVGIWQDWPLRSAAGWVSFTASEAQRRWNEANEDPEASWNHGNVRYLEGHYTYLGDLLTMVINHLLTGMIL